MRANDVVHLALMLGALAAAYPLPFELLLLSYAILGPAHYFTEISWLHDRGYFLPHRVGRAVRGRGHPVADLRPCLRLHARVHVAGGEGKRRVRADRIESALIGSTPTTLA
jgi:hypothetical protein